MDSVEPSAAAYCAAHEGAQASGTCDRCGNFVCPLCLDGASAFPTWCAACREREGAAVIAWERPGERWPKRWLRTARDLVMSPTQTFTSAHPGGFGPPLAFNVVTATGMGIVCSILFACLMGGVLALGVLPGALDGAQGFGAAEAGVGVAMLAGMVVGYPLMLVLSGLVMHVAVTLVYHLAVLAFGGQGGFATSWWAAGYLSIAQLTALPAMILGNVPLIGPLIGMLLWLAVGIWASMQLTTVARVHHRLEGGRATAAGWAPFLLMVGLTLSACLLGVAMLVFAR